MIFQMQISEKACALKDQGACCAKNMSLPLQVIILSEFATQAFKRTGFLRAKKNPGIRGWDRGRVEEYFSLHIPGQSSCLVLGTRRSISLRD